MSHMMWKQSLVEESILFLEVASKLKSNFWSRFLIPALRETLSSPQSWLGMLLCRLFPRHGFVFVCLVVSSFRLPPRSMKSDSLCEISSEDETVVFYVYNPPTSVFPCLYISYFLFTFQFKLFFSIFYFTSICGSLAPIRGLRWDDITGLPIGSVTSSCIIINSQPGDPMASNQRRPRIIG